MLRSQIANVRARYFTPESEIPLAGHPTIATLFALVESNRLQLQGDRTTFSLELRDGLIAVDVMAEDGVVQRVVMSQRKPQFLAQYAADDALSQSGSRPGRSVPNTPIQTVSTGTPQLMIAVVRSLDALRKINLNLAAYRHFRNQADFFSADVFCRQRR